MSVRKTRRAWRTLHDERAFGFELPADILEHKDAAVFGIVRPFRLAPTGDA